MAVGNDPKRVMLRVAIDMRPLSEPNSGIARYARELVGALTQLPDIEPHLMFKQPPRLALAPGTTVDTCVTPLWLHRHVPNYVTTNNIQVFHGTNFVLPWSKRCAHVVTVHDMTLLRQTVHHSLRNLLSTGLQMLLTLASADQIIAVSHRTAREFGNMFPRLASRTTVISHGVGPSFCPGTEADRVAARLHFNSGRRFLLTLGRQDTRKNLESVIRAFAKHKDDVLRNHDLLIVGPTGNATARLASEIAANGLGMRVRVLGAVSEAELPQLLRAADMLVHASLAEGFGLPVLEAMACGTPVITVPDPAVLEYATGVVYNATGYSATAIAQAISLAMDGSNRRETAVADGIKRASDATWAHAALKTANVYRDAALRPHKSGRWGILQ